LWPRAVGEKRKERRGKGEMGGAAVPARAEKEREGEAGLKERKRGREEGFFNFLIFKTSHNTTREKPCNQNMMLKHLLLLNLLK
jgi:hypothetical protein